MPEASTSQRAQGKRSYLGRGTGGKWEGNCPERPLGAPLEESRYEMDEQHMHRREVTHIAQRGEGGKRRLNLPGDQ